jgi:hypothetical protein
VGQAEAVGEGDVAGPHHGTDLYDDLRAATLGGEQCRVSVGEVERGGIAGRHPQGAVGVTLPPGGVADDGVGGERASLARGEHERELRVVAGTVADGQGGQLVQQHVDVEVEEPAGGAHP